ncbi:MAG TPA: hypothetical protein VLF69_01265 [Candidatus Saccharimonadales bacterium]|nr:hypothetical protein [Candidatus Saccharimonadales bacterium]
MVCIYCASPTHVTNSRPQKRLQQVWRRRLCSKCGAIFTSIESADLSSSLVVRHTDGSVAPFSRDRLFLSVLKAVGHRTAPTNDAGALTATIIGKLLQMHDSAAISPGQITTTALAVLKNFDQAAATQYQAYHAVQAKLTPLRPTRRANPAKNRP